MSGCSVGVGPGIKLVTVTSGCIGDWVRSHVVESRVGERIQVMSSRVGKRIQVVSRGSRQVVSQV